MSELTIDEQYAAELKQSDIDHHVPTAGAMTNHILSNLMVAYVKLTQVKWYVKGPQSLALRTAYQRLLDQNVRQFAELGELLLDENQKPSSTTAELTKYSMLEENGAFKYQSADELVAATIKDFDTENLFVDRAIKLAEKETRPALAAWLVLIVAVTIAIFGNYKLILVTMLELVWMKKMRMTTIRSLSMKN